MARRGARRLGRWLGILGPETGAAAERGPHWRLDYVASIGTVSWLIHLCVAILAGFGLAYRLRAAWAGPSVYAPVHAALTGLSWGGGALLCAAMASPDILTFYTLVLGGIVLGAVSSLHVMARSCAISVWTSMPLLAAAWVGSDAAHGAASIAAMVLLFGAMLNVLAIRMDGFVAQSVRLADELAAKNAVLTRTSAQLAEAYEDKSRFLAQASHDLRQPIHAIGLFVAYLGGLRLGNDGREVLANIDRSLESLTRLCRSLLDLSALDVGRVKPQTDPALLHAMVQNLVSNAIKYAPGSRVLVGARRRQGRLAIVVADDGPGIAEADQKRVFREFVQIRTPQADEVEGLGLGLSIVKRLAEMMSLKIGLVSQPDKGACFSIEGLVEAPPGAPRASRPHQTHTSETGGSRSSLRSTKPLSPVPSSIP